jgi:hypothetical protein
MKKIILSISVLAVVFFYAACKPEKPAIFAKQDGIYFNATADSLLYSFAKYPHRTKDTLWIPVQILGNPASDNKAITIEKAPGSDLTAIEGVHYNLMNTYAMPTGKVSTLLPVVVYRTPDMESAAVSFKLQLKENENFALGITAKSAIKVNIGYMQKPATWGEFSGSNWAGYSGNFGTWTKTKYKLILDALYNPVGDTTVSEFPYLRTGAPVFYLQYLQIVKNYIRTNYPGNVSTPVGIGPTLLDPDAGNLPVQVNPANY